MIFNSVQFALFLPLAFFLYWSLSKPGTKAQNVLLLVASYFFYACWDWRFLSLIAFSTLLDYFTGLKIAESSRHKKTWLAVSVIVNLSFLAVFKYYDFFVSSFSAGLADLGLATNPALLNVVLPVGISFYTFHGLSYVIDNYKGTIKPERNIVTYALFVSFFPLLVAGPIERADHLLPQLKRERHFSYEKAVDGLRQILWGLFKKVVIADNCATYANIAFENPMDQSGSSLLVGTFFFAIQIYCDFSGYSDIALGTARVFGIELLRNFAFPYFSRNIAEFWRRWHISLSTWFRDYVYIPLGGNRGTVLQTLRNVLIVFLLSGLWHGANWTFIVWGILHGLMVLPSTFFRNEKKLSNLPTVKDLPSIAITFLLVMFAWIFFRANSISDAIAAIGNIFSTSLFTAPVFTTSTMFLPTLAFIFIFLMIEWLGRRESYALAGIGTALPVPARWLTYYVILILIFVFAGTNQQFIYFQF
jgi:alginate O-acetyltransferase complex protein AlgI